MVASGDVVTAYAASRGIRPARASWDYADEAPLRDARGFDMGRGTAHPSQLTDVEDPTLANVVLTNGARLYVDHAHPEYSSPEVTTPRAAVTWDRAGELVMREAVARLATVPPGVNLYKNNTDGKGVSYGTHENYLMARSTPFASIVRHLTPFFVVRQVMCGSGPGRHRGRLAAPPATRSRSAATSSRSRSGSRPPSSAPSSTPATSRTRSPTATGGCTSSSVTPTTATSRTCSRWAPPRWSWP